MNIKKILLIIVCLFVFSGCKIEDISNKKIEKNVDLILSKNIKYSNQDAIGYQYYLPNYISIKETNEFNQELYFQGKTFYMYTDIVSYYHKVKKDYKEVNDVYYSKKINNNGKKGYLEIKEVDNRYYIEMMYNYAKIEGFSSKNDLVDSVSSIAYILNSIKYNDNVIETLIGSKKYELSDNETYNIFETKKKTDGNFLDYANEYDTYKGEDINNLIEKEEINSDE